MRRRYPAVVAVLAAVAGLGLTARDTPAQADPVFSRTAGGWMPFAPRADGVSQTWFCPGVPASGVDGEQGEIVVANRGEDQLVGTVLLVGEDGQSTRLDLVVDGWGTARVDLDATLPGRIVGGVVEMEGGGAVVEQRSIHPGGNSVAPCSNSTSDEWYLADGFTVDGSLDQLILTNPFDQTVVVNIEFATQDGARRPNSYRGITIGARSVRLIDLGAPGAGAQSEPILAVSVEASRGRLVVGRFQHFLGGGRLGTQTTLAMPALSDQWWFSGGEVGDGVAERYSIYNPTDDDVEVDAIFLGIPVAVQADPIAVPSGEVRTFDPTTITGGGVLPDGRYAVVFSTLASESVVVERATTRTVGDDIATTVSAGAPRRSDGYFASEWHVPSGPSDAVAPGLLVHNADNVEGTVTVFAVGTSGPVPVPGLQDVVLPAASLLAIDLVDPIAFGRELIVSSSNRVFVERLEPTGRGETRTSAWAIPAG